MATLKTSNAPNTHPSALHRLLLHTPPYFRDAQALADGGVEPPPRTINPLPSTTSARRVGRLGGCEPTQTGRRRESPAADSQGTLVTDDCVPRSRALAAYLVVLFFDWVISVYSRDRQRETRDTYPPYKAIAK